MKVVIADDTLKSQMQTYLALRTRHSCEIAEDRETVIRLVHEYEPDVIILALKFDTRNDSNGEWEHLVEELKQIKTAPTLIGISNGENQQLEEKAKEIGLKTIIYRPIQRRKLLEIIAESGEGETNKKNGS